MVALTCWTKAAGWSLSHADLFGQHYGNGRSPWCNPIKAAARPDAKMAKRARPPVAWHRRSGTISEAPSSRRAGRDQAHGYCDIAFRDCGGGDHHGMGMARGDGPDAAIPAGAG